MPEIAEKYTHTATARLLIAASEHDADMLYISGLFVPDPFIAIEIHGAWHGLLSPLEVDRARKDSRFEHVHIDSPWREKAEEYGWETGLASIAAAFLQEQGVQHLQVPGTFPLHFADQLRDRGFSVQAVKGTLFPERAIKSDMEIKQLRKAERLTRQAMCAAESFLREATIDNHDFLRHAHVSGRVKSAHLRAVIETFLIARGAIPSHTIVACGRQAADPHQIGHGFLKAHQPIIIDIFPRLVSSGYWGDMTRTYVKGKASTDIKKLYRTVREGQDIGLSMVADGQSGARIHQTIQAHFTACGFVTGVKRGKQIGFFHGTGHGVGLDIHEQPRISVRDDTLRAGQVVTVEPGLYYPGLGGVRLEDMVVVRKNGCDNLTRHRRKLEID
ncbi:MAG: Xaa-Pro peptidase family protein [Mariprofundaceae bacterium]|nr:Xaa-Pro peptidase family protein [Mariprofundaceae bacterium]